MLDHVKTFECAGAPSMIAINKDDVMLTDVNGRKVHYVEAPGTYILKLRRVQVKRELSNLNADLSIVGQATVGNEGPLGLNLDVSQSLLPEKKMFSPAKCDRNSGVVVENGKHFCRMPTENFSTFQSVLRHLLAAEWSVLEHQGRHAQRQSALLVARGGRDEGTRKFHQVDHKLKNGGTTWKLRVFLRLNSNSQPSADENQFYMFSRKCASCVTRDDCSEACKSDYVAHCLRGTPTSIACLTIEFTAKVTNRYSDVQAYLQRHSYADHRKPTCAIKNSASRQYCKIQWNDDFCCSLCEGRCAHKT
ncbi:unnamed protein product [Soboliphyme baturini]|uniref:PLAC domain-containing protein n=1 Tax=Soboliphyme baturini TaxID=241478 RepID=A0A183IQV4_9BILA|nr:unnamed protein product [Soboliphyme baturini]